MGAGADRLLRGRPPGNSLLAGGRWQRWRLPPCVPRVAALGFVAAVFGGVVSGQCFVLAGPGFGLSGHDGALLQVLN